MAQEFGNFRLSKDTVAYLQTLKQAYEICYGRSFTNDEFIRQMSASVESGDIAVWDTFCELSDTLETLKERAKQRRN